MDLAVGTAEYGGEHIGFSTAACRRVFLADPVYYLNLMRLRPALHGYRSRWPTQEAMAKASRAVGAANGLCPVTRKLVVREGGRAPHRRQRIGFASQEARQTFLRDPERWMRAMRADPLAYGYDRPGPTHGELRAARAAAGTVNGLCPVMRNPVRPNGGFAVVDGKRIGFCCPPCKGKFVGDSSRYLGLMRGEPAVYGYVQGSR